MTKKTFNFIDTIIGTNITFVRFACNSLLLYLDCMPGDRCGLIIWLDAPWQITDSKTVVLGSEQSEEDEVGFDAHLEYRLAVGKKLGRGKILSYEVDRISHSIQLITHAFTIRSFTHHSDDDHLWHIRMNRTGKTCTAGSRLVALSNA